MKKKKRKRKYRLNRKARNRIRYTIAFTVIGLILALIIFAGYQIGTHLFGHDDTVYVNEDYGKDKKEPASNVLGRVPSDVDVEAIINDMSLHEMVSQMFVSTPEALTDSDDSVTKAGSLTETRLNSCPLGGLVYSDKNFEDDQQSGELIRDTQDYSLSRSGIELFVGVHNDGEDMTVGETAKRSDVKMAYFPVTSGDDAAVSGMAQADIQTKYLDPLKSDLEGTNVIAVARDLKVSSVDSESVCVSRSWVKDILRGDMGYDGVVMTDDLKKLSASQGEEVSALAVESVKAGCDLIYVSDGYSKSIQAVEAAVENGEISEERIEQSVRRILTLKAEFGMIALDDKNFDTDDEDDDDEDIDDSDKDDDDSDKKKDEDSDKKTDDSKPDSNKPDNNKPDSSKPGTQKPGGNGGTGGGNGGSGGSGGNSGVVDDHTGGGNDSGLVDDDDL